MNVYKNTYPRPQFQRDSFLSLDGQWDLNGNGTEVPFPKESDLSGYQNKDYEKELIYTKVFVLPEDFLKEEQRLILHFTAVDQICDLWVNDTYISHHEGGYLPFAYDITESLKEENRIVLNVKDDLDTFYPYGKQCREPHGMWYTPVSGIWGSVWLEAVPETKRIDYIRINTSLKTIHIEVETDAQEFELKIPFDDGIHKVKCNDKSIDIELSKLPYKYRLWSPDEPVLYDLIISTDNDEVRSYFGIRELGVKTVNGYKRLFLNDEPLFLNGVLDQGYFEDGIYLPEDPEEYRWDILRMKELGFNMLRKHIKVEPEIFYHYCDKEGILVMQDMVNSGVFRPLADTIFPTIGSIKKDDTKNVDRKRYDFFIEHSKGIIKHLYSHPCIVSWTIYNEGWGQQDSTKAYRSLKELDPDRIFDTASGWFKPNESDIDSYHVYFRNKILKTKETDKVLLLSEFGGVVRKVEGHVFSKRKANYGYGKKDTEEALSHAILDSYQKMVIPSIKNGLCGCIYTQVSDVEEEVNGLYTYDRKVCKVNKKTMREIKDMVDKTYEETLK